ncbi:MAG: RNA polymerase factor sigma-54 [Kiritimatiellae bacterium]|nr:RNA polymerase factor sigma-54 [Kiritimatiellia bacterium]
MLNNPGLTLRQDQRQLQVLAPQLRQSLELLQVPVLELRALIQKELQQNPVLEEKGDDSIALDPQSADDTRVDAKELNFKEDFEVLMRLDRETHDYFLQEYEPYNAAAEKKRDYALEVRAPDESLQEHLAKQLAMLEMSDRDRRIGELIIGSINEEGYLTQSIEELAVSAGYEAECLYDVLAVIRDFDPVGVGARDLKDCLLLQLQRFGHDSSLAARIVSDHLNLLAARNYGEMARALGVADDEVRTAAKMIATLDPRPGLAFGGETAPYIFPEIFVEKGENGYHVVLNDERIPRLRISRYYQQLMSGAQSTEEVRKYIMEKVKGALFLMKSIEQRQHTLRRVAVEIIKVQSDFFDSGVAFLKPLTMSDVARRIGLHETTVCRCVANKFMKTPRGVFAMKYFFTPGLKTSDGHLVSNKAIQDLVAGMVAEEDPAHPLSDQEIFERLSARGLQIARRTVAKYRLALKIPPSHIRRSG